jgi:hypothetical protein
MTNDRSIEEPCEVTSLTHGFEAERRGRPLRLGSDLDGNKADLKPIPKFEQMTRVSARTSWIMSQKIMPNCASSPT